MRHLLLKKIWEEEQVPMDWIEIHLIKIPKKNGPSKCENYRGITLLSVPGNVFNRVLMNWMKDSLDAQFRDQQSGFRKDRWCTDQIATLRIIVEQSVDYEKAFYSMYRRTSWKLFRHYGVFEKMVNIIRHSYYGLHCKYNTENINPITLDGETLEEVKTLTYLNSIIHEQGESDTDVKARIGKARTAFLQLSNIWNSKQLSTNIKVRISNTNVMTLLLYGAENRRTTTTIIKKVQVFINSCLRNIRNSHWPDTISNNLL
ncbi:unnamed protein product [Schistosoma curassoni]|uniref:Reverse transcriptase domain-containing protein n=1 Tax=Schistosoma curassoni TaxID=6186 RepID=A0A183KIL8_9TREM|nr:unnamed protein product [Schistosoma curassoni]